jgi:hypothetical protein
MVMCITTVTNDGQASEDGLETHEGSLERPARYMIMNNDERRHSALGTMQCADVPCGGFGG